MPIKITSKKNGFWRCGVQHTATPVTYQDDRFSKKELETLKAEPMLVVEALDGGKKSGKDEGQTDGKTDGKDEGKKNK